jgi:hypothetical protein
MFHIKEMKSFISGFFEKPPKEVLPLWMDYKKNQPLREVVVITDQKYVKKTTKKSVHFSSQPIEIRVVSCSSYTSK